MAQVVRPQGFIGPLVVTVIGVVLVLNGVPALFQWIGWVAQTALVIGVEGALDTALGPLLLAGGATFIGFLMLRGGVGALMSLARGATKRAQAQLRGGAQQARREVGQRYDDARQQVGERYGEARAQAEHLRPAQGWMERIESLGRDADSERARRAGQPVAAQQARPQQARQPQQPQRQAQQPQRQAQPQRQPQQPQRQAQPQRSPQPGADRLGRIEDLRQRVDSRVQQTTHLQDAGTQAAERVRQAAFAESARVQQRQLPNPSDDVTALIGQLDRADGEHVRRRGSTLVRSSLTTSSLSKTSLRLDSLLARRH